MAPATSETPHRWRRRRRRPPLRQQQQRQQRLLQHANNNQLPSARRASAAASGRTPVIAAAWLVATAAVMISTAAAAATGERRATDNNNEQRETTLALLAEALFAHSLDKDMADNNRHSSYLERAAAATQNGSRNDAATQAAALDINWPNFALAAVLVLLMLTTAIGNLFVIVAILIERNLRTVGNYLVLSLAIADLLVACLVMPLAGIYQILQRWTLGVLLCDIWTSADVFCCTGECNSGARRQANRLLQLTDCTHTHSLNPAPARHCHGQVLGCDPRRLHPVPARQATNFADDLLCLGHRFGDLIGASVRLEGRPIRRAHHKRQRVPYFARHRLPNIRLLHNFLLSAHSNAGLLLENLPGKLWGPIFNQSLVGGARRLVCASRRARCSRAQ